MFFGIKILFTQSYFLQVLEKAKVQTWRLYISPRCSNAHSPTWLQKQRSLKFYLPIFFFDQNTWKSGFKLQSNLKKFQMPRRTISKLATTATKALLCKNGASLIPRTVCIHASLSTTFTTFIPNHNLAVRNPAKTLQFKPEKVYFFLLFIFGLPWQWSRCFCKGLRVCHEATGSWSCGSWDPSPWKCPNKYWTSWQCSKWLQPPWASTSLSSSQKLS